MQTYHIRRRLTSAEQAETGDLIDIRGTAEQDKRWRAVMKYLPAAYRHWKD